MKKGLITLTLAILPAFGFANINLTTLISQNTFKTNDTCTIQYNANHNKTAFCTCYGNELHDNDRFNPKRPAHIIFNQMCHLSFPVACRMGCGTDNGCYNDCIEATNDYVSAGCDHC